MPDKRARWDNDKYSEYYMEQTPARWDFMDTAKDEE